MTRDIQIDATTAEALEVRDLGLADYREVLSLQQDLNRQRQAGQIPDTVLIVEHPPVITLGARQSANRLLVDPDELRRRGIDVVEIRRGGGATAHNPGQLVFYPIVHLQRLGLSASEYVRTLEAIGIDLSGRRHGRKAKRLSALTGGRKIARSACACAGRDVPRHGHQPLQ